MFLALHRTKCIALISCVLGPSMLTDWRKDIDDIAYSLVIDESTDVATEKQLCIVVPYSSLKNTKIINSILGLVILESIPAEAVTCSLMKFMETLNLDARKCTGLATDDCNTMCGAHNSVIARCRKINLIVLHIKTSAKWYCNTVVLQSSFALWLKRRWKK